MGSSISRIVLEYSNGRRYVIEGEELEVFLTYIHDALMLLAGHGADMTGWNNLMKKILREWV